MLKKDTFSSRLAFILSAAGSAIGLGNIWKFPYMTGKFEGGTFLVIYMLFLLLVGIPAFLSEILIGNITEKRPDDAFLELGKSGSWKKAGLITIWTGFFVSTFYSVVAGWILGYFFETLCGNIAPLNTIHDAHLYYTQLMQTPYWALSYHALFAAICGWFLYYGVRKGIERCNRIFMPLFFCILLLLVGWATILPTSGQVLSFLTHFDWSKVTPAMTISALGHAFFTLSVGQGTLVTYGSYLAGKEKILGSSLLIVIADTLVSIFAAFIILNATYYFLDFALRPSLVTLFLLLSVYCRPFLASFCPRTAHCSCPRKMEP
jgi:NSS family neurotransmitter:Na+ symporter